MYSFKAHENKRIVIIKQSPFDYEYVATVDFDGVVKIWMTFLDKWSLIQTYTIKTAGIEWINGDILASRYAQTISIWSISSGQTQRTINTSSIIYSLKLLSNGCLAAGVGTKINIYKISDGSLVSSLIGHTDDVNDLILINSDILASGSSLSILIWNLTTNASKFIPNGNYKSDVGLKQVSTSVIVSGYNDSTIKLWNITNGTLIRTLTETKSVILDFIDVIINTDGEILMSVEHIKSNQTISLWNLSTGKRLLEKEIHLNISSLVVIN